MRLSSFRHCQAAFAFFVILSLLLPPRLAVQARPAAAPAPSAANGLPAEALLGTVVTFPITFSNTGDATGYGPFIDLTFPAAGADGGDGLTFLSASYQTLPISVGAPITVPAGGCVAHPIAQSAPGVPVNVCGLTPGDQFLTIVLPFGSFVPTQPAAVVQITAALSPQADAGTGLVVRSRGGFRFGADEFNNPTVDAPIFTAFNPRTLIPTVIRLTKTSNAPEAETASGPNFPVRFTLTVDIADTQTVAPLTVTDRLPDNLAFLRVVSSTPAGAAIIEPAALGEDLGLTWPSVTGGAGAADAVVVYEVYVPYRDADDALVISPVSGDDTTSINDALAGGTWTPADPRDTPGPVSSDATAQDYILNDRSIAIQKGLANVSDTAPAGFSPGDVIEYTLNLQVSDFFAFDNLVLTDIISDGQRFQESFSPTLAVNGNGFDQPAAALGSFNLPSDVIPNYTPADSAPNDGTTTITFRLSDELIARGRANGWLVGGCVPLDAAGTTGGTGGPDPDCADQNTGPTLAQVRYRTVIQANFSDTFPSGDPSVDQGDILRNTVEAAGDLLAADADLGATGQAEADGSGEQLQVARGSLSKSVYAVNGSTSVGSPVRVAAGDELTYRLRYVLATGDVEDLVLTDYLPLPVFSSAEVTTFDPTITPRSDAPPAGTVSLGPDDTYYDYFTANSHPAPVVTSNPGQNSFQVNFGTFNGPTPGPYVIDLLFTVTVEDDPFADGLFLTNEARAQEGSTNSDDATAVSAVQIILTEPELRISKGVLATDRASGATFTPAAVGPVTFTAPGGACAFQRDDQLSQPGRQPDPQRRERAGLW